MTTLYKSEDRALKKGEEFKLSPSRSQEKGEVYGVTSELSLLLMNELRAENISRTCSLLA